MRIEDTMPRQALSHFELEVKAKLACVPSAAEECVTREDAEEKNEKVRSVLTNLIEKAKLTSRQKACYELIFVEELSDRGAAQRLSITEGRLRWLKIQIVKALQRARQNEIFREDALRQTLTKKQKLVVQYRFEELLSIKEIAARIGSKERAVKKLLRLVQQKILKENLAKGTPS